MKRTRQAPDERKAAILAACLKLAERSDYRYMTRSQIAGVAGCSNNLITYYFDSMSKLRAAVMSLAIEKQSLPIIRQGLLARDTRAMKAPETLRRAAVAAML